MEIFKKDITYGFMGRSKLFLAISGALILASLVLLFTRGLNYGIDFTGGTLVQVKYAQTAPIKEVRQLLSADRMFDGSQVSNFGSEEEIIIRIPTSTTDVGSDIGDKVRGLLKESGEFEIRRVDIVGPKVGGELREKGMMAALISIIAILIYIAIRFEWRFAIASVIALVHDVTISLGAIALFQIDVNLDILAAVLTIMGYSLNDTIIVFDRIREGIKTLKESILNTIIDMSVSKTLSRTTLTSLTTFFVVLTLYLFGGEIINGFSFTLLVGVVVGTYSSIFIASPLLSILKFNVKEFREKEARAEKQKAEKDKMRKMYESGVV
jgi:preprotein translocase subunit SecF